MQSYNFHYYPAGFYAAFLFLLLLVLNCQCNGPSSEVPPNIVIINVDDMGWRDVGFMGSEFYETRHIDSLASMAAVFTNGYASAANCAPSRACLMTGLWPPRHGIYTVGTSERGASADRKLIPVANETTLDEQLATLPEILAMQGYQTCHAGKWHLSDNPLEYGFHQNIGGAHNGHPQSYFHPFGNVDLPAQPGENLTNSIMDNVIGFVNSANDPFFLYYAPYAVHTPIQPVIELKSKYENKPQGQEQFNVDYATMIENLDRNIGRLVGALKETGAWENTLLVFTSDNGGLYGITYQYPLRAGKGSYYEGGIRVPFFILWNKRVTSQRYTTPVTNLDLFPTLLEAAGTNLSQHSFDGVSLLPLATSSTHIPERPLYWHFPIYLQAYNVKHNQNRDSLFRTRPGSVIRLGDWKLHHYFEDDGLELYHLKEDISEQHNLVQQYPAKAEELFNLLKTWRSEVNAPPPPAINPDFKPVTVKLLME